MNDSFEKCLLQNLSMGKTIIQVFLLTIFLISVFAQSKETQKIDEFGIVSCDSGTGHLDRLLYALSRKPDTKAYIISYDGYRISSLNNKKHIIHEWSLPRIRVYKQYIDSVLRNSYSKPKEHYIDESRIVYLDGGYRAEHRVEIWLIPEGSNTPELAPTVNIKDKSFRNLKVKRRSLWCIYL